MELSSPASGIVEATKTRSFTVNFNYGGEGGDYIAPFSATLLFSITSFVKPAFSVV